MGMADWRSIHCLILLFLALFFLSLLHQAFAGVLFMVIQIILTDMRYMELILVHHQGNVNWARLRNALIEQSPVRFVFMKSTEGDSHVDRNFRSKLCKTQKKQGLLGVFYHFWSNNSSPRRQAYFYLAMTPLEPGDLPPVLDVETKPNGISTGEFQTEYSYMATHC